VFSLYVVILEPRGRNTAAAVALAALELSENDPDACMLVLPSDHVLGDRQAFLDTVKAAHGAAMNGRLVTFGMGADKPETGYGYIRRGEPLTHADGCFHVDRFVEKPDLETAKGFLSDGNYHWNSGMFMFTARRYLEELRVHNPATLSACIEALGKGGRDGAFVLPDAETFATAENISMDYAVMERTGAAAMVAASFGWSDVGSWSSLAGLGGEDAEGNVAEGDVLLEGCKGTYVRSSGRLVAAVGLED
jgi:mannose-1-phosphate guanylyltransferase/mannose-6-phosphate isomerase